MHVKEKYANIDFLERKTNIFEIFWASLLSGGQHLEQSNIE